MRILITGAGGNIGHGLVDRLIDSGDHQMVLTDLVGPRWLTAERYGDAEFRALDVQIGVGLDDLARDCDVIVHLPAWHGIHSRERSEIDFWRLNVDGTFWVLQAARRAGISKMVFLSSQSWHGHYDTYGFTKRVGEELLAYHHVRHGLSYVAVRPHDLTPWHGDWPQRYGARLLYGGVDREDVLDAVWCAVEHVASTADAELVLDATRPNVFAAAQLDGWAGDPVAHLESIFPGAADAVRRHGLDVSEMPRIVPEAGRSETGYAPSRHFGTFLEQLRTLSPDEARGMPCPY